MNQPLSDTEAHERLYEAMMLVRVAGKTEHADTALRAAYEALNSAQIALQMIIDVKNGDHEPHR